jgi:prepilin-type N-terminal cleavage/methylation domain-containing protein
MTGKTGFTLIETLISLIIFSVGLMGLSGMTTVIIHGNMLSQKITMATILAHDKIEDLHHMPYDKLQSQIEHIITENQSPYTRETIVLDNMPKPGMKTVSIAVYWTQSHSARRQIALQTIVIDDRK